MNTFTHVYVEFGKTHEAIWLYFVHLFDELFVKQTDYSGGTSGSVLKCDSTASAYFFYVRNQKFDRPAAANE